MFTKTTIALSVALILSAGSAALANDSGENHQDEDRGSVAGVNHPTWSGNSANAGTSYGFASSTRQDSRKKGRNH